MMQKVEKAYGGFEFRDITSSEARDHTPQLRRAFTKLSQHLRIDVDKVDDPKAQALFETAAEVLDSLDKAFDHFEQRSEPAWR